MNKLLLLLICSSFLILAFYLMLPLIISWNGKEIAFALWIYLGIANVLLQPILIGYSTYRFFKIKIDNGYWFALLLTTNTVLFLIPIILIGVQFYSVNHGIFNFIKQNLL